MTQNQRSGVAIEKRWSSAKSKKTEHNPFSFFNYKDDDNDSEEVEENDFFAKNQPEKQTNDSNYSKNYHSKNIFNFQGKVTLDSSTPKSEEKELKKNPYSIFSYLDDNDSNNGQLLLENNNQNVIVPPDNSTLVLPSLQTDELQNTDQSDYNDDENEDNLPPLPITPQLNPSTLTKALSTEVHSLEFLRLPQLDSNNLHQRSTVTIPSSEPTLPTAPATSLRNAQDEMLNILNKYKEENEKLRRELANIRTSCAQLQLRTSESEEKVEQYKKQLQAALEEVRILKEKDQKEEKELEIALKLIEQTLAATKLRAEKAETENQKLINEINSLKEQLRQTQQTTSKTGNPLQNVSQEEFDWITVQEKTLYASQLIKKTVANVKENITKLLENVATVNELSEVLRSAHRISNAHLSPKDDSN
jgi:hypothetical protein